MSLLDFTSQHRGGPTDEERVDLHVTLRKRIPRENETFFKPVAVHSFEIYSPANRARMQL